MRGSASRRKSSTLVTLAMVIGRPRRRPRRISAASSRHDRPRRALTPSLPMISARRRSLPSRPERSASRCHRCSTPVAKRPSLRRTPARIRRMKMSESSRPHPVKAASKPSTTSRSPRQNAMLLPFAPRHCVARRLRKLPSGSANSGAIRLRSPAHAATDARASPNRSGSGRAAFASASACAVRRCDIRMRLPVTNQPGSASRRCAATKPGRAMQSPSRKTR